MLFKSKRFYIGLLVLAIIAASAYFAFGREAKVEYNTAKARVGNLAQTVSETGTVKTASEVNLNFLATGKLAKISVKIGDKILKDQVLAELDYSNLLIKEKESRANLEVSQANLAKITAGATADDIRISQAGFDQADAAYRAAVEDLEKTKKSTAESLVQAQKNLSDLESKAATDITTFEQAVTTAQTNLDNTKSTWQLTVNNRKAAALTTNEDKISAAKTALDSVNRVLTDEDAKNTLSIQDTALLSDTKSGYTEAQSLMAIAQNSLNIAKRTQSDTDIIKSSDATLSLLNKTTATLNDCFSALTKTITSSQFSQAELDSFKSIISGQITIINSAISTVQSNQQALSDAILNHKSSVATYEDGLKQAQAGFNNALLQARNNLKNVQLSTDQQLHSAQTKVDTGLRSLELAKAQLDKTTTGARPEDLRLAQAQVNQAQAALDSIANQINNNVIKAPIDGKITKVNYEIGEEPNASKPVISLLSNDAFEVQVDISEADIVKVKQGNPATVTFDAFGDEINFAAEVIFIEPAQTVIQDVVYYRTTISLIGQATSTTSEQATSTIQAGYLEKIRPGMTANVIIMTLSKDNVLTIPSRALTGDGKTVKVLKNGQVEELAVQVGLRGDDGVTEILAGLKPEDEVITSVKNSK